jgi:sec-independent protein translocase protein TatA
MEIILILVVLLLILGPSKLPAVARSIGDAWREFRKASSELLSRPATEEKGRPLISVAKDLGIEVEGKTDEQLATEILTKVKRKGRRPKKV